ncbi:hypothetical protein C0J52_14089 [Blattella germanica]|nr:hypothetical protein C0J52_14089 [Blattella germanica]
MAKFDFELSRVNPHQTSDLQQIIHQLTEVSLCQNRIKCLRERYCRERKAYDKELKSEGSTSGRQVWPLMDAMSFLEDHIRKRKSYTHLTLSDHDQTTTTTTTTITNGNNSPYSDADIDTEQEFINSDPIQLSPTEFEPISDTSNSMPLIKRDIKRNYSVVGMSTPVSEYHSSVNEAKRRLTLSFENDREVTAEVAAFSQFIAVNLSALPEEIKDDATLQIMNVIMNAKKRARTEQK